MRTFTGYQNDIPRILNNSLADNVTWATEVINDSIRYLVSKYYFNERTYTTTSVAQQQFYNLPPKVKKLINVTVTIGSVIWQPEECPSREYWDSLNTVTFYQDFPSFFFVYNGQVGIWPIPASSGNPIAMHYKTRIQDMSMADVAGPTGSIALSVSNGATAITASATGVFAPWMANNAYVRIPHLTTATGPSGDNQWYQIASVTSAATAALAGPYEGATVAGATGFTIGEVSILPEDYQDLPLYRLGIIYYTTRFPDPVRAQQYQALWDTGLEALNEEFGSKTTSVVLTDTDEPIVNPNLFQRTVS